MAEYRVHDSEQRLAALDPRSSFIVQAPAGSGKTSLLTQRYLKLLAQAQAPEEIIAITFTKKAAAEMRGRILSALQLAQSDEPPQSDHERMTWDIAKRALQQNEARGWGIQASPSRLRVMTIDSLSAWLAKQLPVVSQFGIYQQISESPENLYQQAVHQALQHLEMGLQWSASIERLIEHLDNNLGVVERLLVTLLAKREQWLRHVQRGKASPEMRSELETALAKVVREHLLLLSEHLKQTPIVEHFDLIRFCASHVDSASNLASCRDLTRLPMANEENIEVWLGIAELFLTNDGRWRSKVTKAQGFPAPSSTKNAEEKTRFKEMKACFRELQNTLIDDDVLRASLASVRDLPSVMYDESQWLLLEALFDLLPVVVAELYLVFAEHGTIDFSQMAKSAIEALGEADHPTDLALILDYKIQHIMVDEFQDTSFAQFELLERLTAGWTGEDGRTLFLVGDPMQSIYRFREAEVGFFLRARRHGIGHLKLQSLNLSVNFRSQSGIVDWVNEVFLGVFPKQDNIATGAVSYSSSYAFNGPAEGDAVEVYPCYENDALREAQAVVGVIKKIKAASSAQSIAVIVQARSHLALIIQQLKKSEMSFQAIDVDALSERIVIQDLSSLTRALLHLGDRVAWFSLLRAPWCGLSLHEIERITHGVSQNTVWQCLISEIYTDALSEAARQRIKRFIDVMGQALERRGRCSVRQLVESAWLNLGGPACVLDAGELQDADVYFDLLEQLEQSEMVLNWPLIEQKLSRLFAKPDAEADGRLQLMTIHKSKGLEFDHVLLPGLGRRIAADDKPLLMWMERPAEDLSSDLLLAPLNASGELSDSIYSYLRRVEQNKLENESARLLYVAATRAKKKLYLFGHASTKDEEGSVTVKSPPRATMLAKLWGSLEPYYVQGIETYCDTERDDIDVAKDESKASLFRLKETWQLPHIEDRVPFVAELNAAAGERIEFSWASPAARHVGTLVHWVLMKISNQGLGLWTAERIISLRTVFSQRLTQLGVSEMELPHATDKVLRALINVLEDGRGQWILQENRLGSNNEFAVTGLVKGKIVRGVIDRTFIDDEGVRWVIDYKTGDHLGEGVELFLEQEQLRYRRQLEQYGQIMKNKEALPVRFGLYFPLLKAWREWG